MYFIFLYLDKVKVNGIDHFAYSNKKQYNIITFNTKMIFYFTTT